MMGCCTSFLRCCVGADTENPLLDSSGQLGANGVDGQVDLNLDFDELKDVHYLTNGGMCSIYTAEWRGRRVVVKMPRDDCAQPAVARKDLETEIDILTRLQHPNIVEMLGAGYVCPLDIDADGQEAGEFRDLDQESKRFVLLEYLIGGTLTEQMCLRNPQPEGMMSSVVRRWQQNWQFPTKKALDSALQLSAALSYLHSRAVEGSFVVHRDLKPENIAFSPDGRLKLFDFGLAKIVRRKVGGRLTQRYEMTGETGSTRYMCPEVALQLPYNEKADVYSFGLILWEMLSLKRPFEGLNRKEFVQTVIKGGRRPPLNQDWSGPLRELLARCWDEDMDQRPSFIEVEDILREITQREVTWGGMLTNGSGSSSAHASMSDRSGNGGRGGDSAVGAGSINGRTSSGTKGGVSRSSGRGEVGLLGAVGGGVSNGGAGANEALTGTRTLV